MCSTKYCAPTVLCAHCQIFSSAHLDTSPCFECSSSSAILCEVATAVCIVINLASVFEHFSPCLHVTPARASPNKKELSSSLCTLMDDDVCLKLLTIFCAGCDTCGGRRRQWHPHVSGRLQRRVRNLSTVAPRWRGLERTPRSVWRDSNMIVFGYYHDLVQCLGVSAWSSSFLQSSHFQVGRTCRT